jgi:cellulose synthase operon protein C
MPEWSSGAGPTHPGMEMLSAFVDGTLNERQRHHIEDHVADCERCLHLVTEAVVLQQPIVAEAVTVAAVPRRRSRARARMVVGALGLAATLVLVARLQPAWLGLADLSPRHGLDEVLGAERSVSGRLTGGFAYRPLSPSLRSADPRSPSEETLQLQAHVREMEQRAARDPSVDNRQALGAALLLSGDFDGAVRTLGGLNVNDNAETASDLAAAYLARAASIGDRDDAVRALDAVDRALRLRPDLPEALFNRGLILEYLGLTSDAQQAWEAYLKVDSASGWADEAREHLGVLKSIHS